MRVKRSLLNFLDDLMMQKQEQYVDSGFNSYVAAQNEMHQMSGWRMDNKSGRNFEGCLEAFTPERENSYVTSKAERQWQSKRDSSESKISHSMTSHMFNEG